MSPGQLPKNIGVPKEGLNTWNLAKRITFSILVRNYFPNTTCNDPGFNFILKPVFAQYYPSSVSQAPNSLGKLLNRAIMLSIPTVINTKNVETTAITGV